MGDAIGQVLSFGVGVALSPIPIVGVVLMLGTPRGRSNGPAFIAGWIAGLAAVGTIVLLASSGADGSDQGQPADWVNVLKVVLGALLLLVALRQWRGRPAAGEEAEMPKWMQTIDTFTPGKAAGLAVLLSAVNPKNLLLAVGAAAAISQTGASPGQRARRLRLDRHPRPRTTRRALPRPRRTLTTNARTTQDLDVDPQRRDHGRALPSHRDQAAR